MTIHIFGMVLTHEGTFSNNRGENEGITNTLQKVYRNGDQYTTVSAEAIRYALRESWQQAGEQTNRTMPSRTMPLDQKPKYFSDPDFKKWHKNLDDDILGYMHAQTKTVSRRAPLEVTRAISVTPWLGEVMNNFAAPGSNPAVSHDNPIPYTVEVHHTRYQFGFALTPEAIGREDNTKNGQHKQDEIISRVEKTLNGLISLRRVGGAHARYFSDYSAEAVVLRVTNDPAPRFLYCFEQDDRGAIHLPHIIKRAGEDKADILTKELFIGTAISIDEIKELKEKGALIENGGVKAAVSEAIDEVQKRLLALREQDE